MNIHEAYGMRHMAIIEPRITLPPNYLYIFKGLGYQEVFQGVFLGDILGGP